MERAHEVGVFRSCRDRDDARWSAEKMGVGASKGRSRIAVWS